MHKKSLQSFLLASLLVVSFFISNNIFSSSGSSSSSYFDDSSSESSHSSDPLNIALDCIEDNDLCELHELIKMNQLNTQYLLRYAFDAKNLKAIEFLMCEYGESPLKKNKNGVRPIDYCSNRSIKKKVYKEIMGRALQFYHTKTESESTALRYKLCKYRHSLSETESNSGNTQ